MVIIGNRLLTAIKAKKSSYMLLFLVDMKAAYVIQSCKTASVTNSQSVRTAE